ncbi:unnamed protein product [Symbiodinium natans]|uniref:Expansin-like EG45 domain-containing protein n=1 Tax=Symbiodinium natans TaxID=878477 RepID=A0A812T449_9DINO|nr:unnamed protein product [Symbiodinium natans]CAE7518096.1 unnamed protein product [Symbiodinium natans]
MAMKMICSVLLSLASLAASQTCWAGIPSSITATPGCTDLAYGSNCSVTIAAQTGSLAKCLAAGTYTFACPEAAGGQTFLMATEAYLQCKVCAASFTDTNDGTGVYSGMLYFGQNMLNGVVDEADITAYTAFAVDDCGAPVLDAMGGLTPLGTALKVTSSETCCDSTKYSIAITLTNPTYTKIAVVPSDGANFLKDGVIVDLMDLTTTTTTTMGGGGISGTTTMHLAPAMALGLLAISN